MDSTAQIAYPEQSAMASSDERVAFDDLVTRQSRFVFRVAYAVLRNASDAEDVVQDTFLKLHRSGAWQAMEDEQAYLARVAWRLAVDRVPKPRAVARLEPSAPSHEKDLIASDLQATVHRLIDGLPEELRRPLALSAIEEMNSRQIGALLEIPEGTVRTRLMRARQILREKLTARLEGGK